MGATCGAENAYPSGALEFTPDFSGVHVAQSLVFCVVFCISLFVLFLLTMGLSVLQVVFDLWTDVYDRYYSATEVP